MLLYDLFEAKKKTQNKKKSQHKKKGRAERRKKDEPEGRTQPKIRIQPKAKIIKRKLRVKQKHHRHHIKPVPKVTDEGFFGDLADKATTWAAGKVLAKLGTGGD